MTASESSPVTITIVGISGSLRAASSNAALLRAVARVLPRDVKLVLYDGMGALPHFNPDLDDGEQPPPPAVAALREFLLNADGVVISSPEYAHGVPGALKNLLDWLVSTGELVGTPVALLNASPSGGAYAQSSLAETLRTMSWSVSEEGSLLQPFVKGRIHGELTDDAALARLKKALDAFVRSIRGAPPAEVRVP